MKYFCISSSLGACYAIVNLRTFLSVLFIYLISPLYVIFFIFSCNGEQSSRRNGSSEKTPSSSDVISIDNEQTQVEPKTTKISSLTKTIKLENQTFKVVMKATLNGKMDLCDSKTPGPRHA